MSTTSKSEHRNAVPIGLSRLPQLTPGFSAKEWVNARDYKDRAIPKRFLVTLHQLGLTE